MVLPQKAVVQVAVRIMETRVVFQQQVLMVCLLVLLAVPQLPMAAVAVAVQVLWVLQPRPPLAALAAPELARDSPERLSVVQAAAVAGHTLVRVGQLLTAAAQVARQPQTARQPQPTLAVGAAPPVAVMLVQETAATAAAVLSLFALRVHTHLLRVKRQSVEQPRERTQVAAHLMPTTRSIHLAH
jgi:hypothetical protein